MYPLQKSIRRSRTLKDLNNFVQIVAILGAGIWAIWQFYYSYHVLPSAIPAHLTVSSELRSVGKTSRFVVVKAIIRVRNETSTRVEMLASAFNMKAHNIDPNFKALLPSTEFINRPDIDFAEQPQWSKDSHCDVVNSGRLFPINGWWLDANEEQDIEFVTYVPNNYDLVDLRSDFRIARNHDYDKLRIAWGTGKDGSANINLKVVAKDKSTEPYDYVRHHDLLGEGTPYRIYTSSLLVLHEQAPDPGAKAQGPPNPMLGLPPTQQLSSRAMQ